MIDVTIEDNVVPQLLTSALEAYDFGQHLDEKRETQIETFGLLWGYVIDGREGKSPRVIATMSTVETSAKRKPSSVQPDFESLRTKRDFIQTYWPHIDIVGTFHSHPYESLGDVKSISGWEASSPENLGLKSGGDTEFWPGLHEEICPDLPYMAHLIVTVCALKRDGWAAPKKFSVDSGFELTAGRKKLWITSYATEAVLIEEESEGVDKWGGEQMQLFRMMEYSPILDIPALVHRFK